MGKLTITDKRSIGLLAGTLLPIVTILGYYLIQFYPTYPLREFWFYLLHNKSLLTAVGSICLVTNMVLFTLFINRKKDQIAIGIFIISAGLGIATLAAKFLL